MGMDWNFGWMLEHQVGKVVALKSSHRDVKQ